MAQAVLRVVGKDSKEDSEKKRALEAALSHIDRAFGKVEFNRRDLNYRCGVWARPSGFYVEHRVREGHQWIHLCCASSDHFMDLLSLLIRVEAGTRNQVPTSVE